jgi:hypothetical protein
LPTARLAGDSANIFEVNWHGNARAVKWKPPRIVERISPISTLLGGTIGKTPVIGPRVDVVMAYP